MRGAKPLLVVWLPLAYLESSMTREDQCTQPQQQRHARLRPRSCLLVALCLCPQQVKSLSHKSMRRSKHTCQALRPIFDELCETSF